MSDPTSVNEPLRNQTTSAGLPADSNTDTSPGATLASSAPLSGVAIDAAIAIAVMLVVTVLAGMVWGLARGLALVGEGVDSTDMLKQLGEPGVLFQVITTIVAMSAATALLILYRRRPTPQEWTQSLSAVRKKSTWGWALTTGILMTVITTGITMLAGAFGIKPDPSNEALIRSLFAQYPWLLFPFAVGLAPLYEELLFRRVFYGRFLAAGRPISGLAISAALFAVLHEIPGTGGNNVAATAVLWMVYVTMGAGFAMVYRHCGTIWAAVGAHATHNLLACLWLFYETG